MISGRYATAVLVLVVLALVPTLIHSYAGLVVSDGRRTASLPGTLAGVTSRPSGRNATWGQRRFESEDWIERQYATDTRDTTLTVIRSFDLKALYHHPELAVAYGTAFSRQRVETVATRPDLPLHVLESDREEGPVAVYVLHYGEGFVEDPIKFQIRTAAELLFRGRRAMTLFFAQRSSSTAGGGGLSKEPALVILLAAVDAFLAQTPETGQ